LRRIREVALGAYVHQEIPFEKLVEAIRPNRGIGHSPFFQVLFDYYRAVQNMPALPGVSQSRMKIDLKTAKFNLSLNIRDTEQTLSACLEYDRDLFDTMTITEILEQYQSLLQNVIVDPDQKISGLASSLHIDHHQLLDKALLVSEQMNAVTNNNLNRIAQRRAQLAVRRVKLSAHKRARLAVIIQDQ
jgi:non-ribosomal peptide synthetase component F